MEVFKWLTVGIVVIIVLIIVSIVVIRTKQKKRMNEARVRGIRTALEEKRQYELLRKFEGTEDEYVKQTEEQDYTRKRRDFRR